GGCTPRGRRRHQEPQKALSGRNHEGSNDVNNISNDGDLGALLSAPVDAPVGELLLAASRKGLVRVAYANEDHDRVLHTLGQTLGWRILRAPDRLVDATREIEEYFTRQRR